MQKIDYKKELKHLYRPTAKKVSIVDVPEMNYLMIDGEGDPNTAQSFKDAIEALYPLSYTLKFMLKRGLFEIDYAVMPLEGLWWADDMSTFSVEDKGSWQWTLMMMQPELITAEMVVDATEQVQAKKKPIALSQIRFEAFTEGKVAQTLHIGPFTEEGTTIEKLHALIKEEGGQRTGKHHEIYLSDMRRAAPEKWRTVIRQPFA